MSVNLWMCKSWECYLHEDWFDEMLLDKFQYLEFVSLFISDCSVSLCTKHWCAYQILQVFNTTNILLPPSPRHCLFLIAIVLLSRCDRLYITTHMSFITSVSLLAVENIPLLLVLHAVCLCSYLDVTEDGRSDDEWCRRCHWWCQHSVWTAWSCCYIDDKHTDYPGQSTTYSLHNNSLAVVALTVIIHVSLS